MELMEAPGMGQGTAEPRAQAPQIEIRNLRKVYPAAMGEVVALDDLSLTIEKGDIYGIIGMSGAGKSTLIRCLNRLDTPSDGQVFIDGRNILAMNHDELRQTRRRMAMKNYRCAG